MSIACGSSNSADENSYATGGSSGWATDAQDGALGGVEDTPSGGAPAGGSVASTTGGQAASGGVALATGGTTPTGGMPPTGGTAPTGGTPPTGGNAPAGGMPPTGGTAPSGGVPATGGTALTGGTAPTGGTPAAGGTAPTGGMGGATGGVLSDGGSPPTGGAEETGGSASGGTTGTGGTATGGAEATGGTAGTGGSTDDPCVVPPPPSPLMGWADVSGSGMDGVNLDSTTGGGNATPITVTSLSELNDAADGTEPAVIYVSGVMEAGMLDIGSNKTIAGLCGAELHGRVRVSGSHNVIVRNLKIIGYNCTDSPNDCSAGADAVSTTSGAHHVWFDHCDVSDGSDGNFDINAGSDFITVSYARFSYSTARTDPDAGASGHRFSNLIGSADDVPEDVNRLNVTYHHCWWAENVDQRMPRTRRGKIHVFNNLFTSTGNSYCTNAGNEAALLVENNVYIGVNNPFMDDSNSYGMEARGNLLIDTTGTDEGDPRGGGFNPDDYGYQYTLDGTADLEATLRVTVGPQG